VSGRRRKKVPDCLAKIPNKVEKLDCYSGLHSARARVWSPRDEGELRRIFAYVEGKKHRVTFRAGTHAFDSQSLGEDYVVSLKAFDSIDVSLEGNEPLLRVGAGATWGAILDKLEPLGLFPASMVTASQATAGGTLAGDCLSRFSPAYGKEGTRVESFDLLTMGGKRLVCGPPRKLVPREDWTLEERAFCGVIGGLGYLGAVVAITYRVLSVGHMDDPIGVRTRIRKYKSFENLARALVPTTRQTYTEDSDPTDPTKIDSIYSGLYGGRRGKQTALLFISTITTARERRPLTMHRPKLIRRVLVEWVMRRRFFCWVCWRFFYRFSHEDREYIDDLAGFTFFMDGNARARRIGKRFRFKMRTIQQTFIVPSDPGSERGWSKAEDDLLEWLEHADRCFRKKNITPTLFDVMFLPEDERFLLSATTGLAGFAVSYAFETSNRRTLKRVKKSFRKLSDDLWTKFKGRVYLVKNVHAEQSTLAEMYGENAVEFFNLKRELDPDGILANEFLERTFGDLLKRNGPPAE
jgi:decaprenylphospho-beta-D-ribofuranose 2-oxidase